MLREQARTLSPYAARVSMWYVISHLRLSDWWRSALVSTLAHQGRDAVLPCGSDLDMVLGTPGAWTNIMMMDASTFDMRAWLRGVQALADQYDHAPPPAADDRSA